MKIKVFLLAFVMIFSALPFSCVAYEKADSNFAANVEDFLIMLNIADDEEIKTANITRAKFIDLVIKALNIENPGTNDGYFTDVSEEHEFVSSIYKAKELGVISGKNGAKFYPDEPISQSEAVKVTACALGYMRVAEALGGFPIGYFTVADNADLLSRVSSGDFVTYENAYIMIFNMMNADKCEINGIVGGDAVYKVMEGKTVITENWGLRSLSGIVRTAGHISIEPDVYYEENVVSINGNVFKTDIQGIEDCLGLSVTGYYDEQNILKAIYKESTNTIYTLSAEELLSYNNFKINYADEDDVRPHTLDVDVRFSFVKNGKGLNCSDEDFKFENGYFTMIDSDADGKIDCIIAKESTYMVVSGISNLNDSVYDLKAGKTVTFKRNEGYYYELRDVYGNDITPASLEENMVLTVYESEDGKYVEAVMSLMSIKGTVTEIGNDNTVKIDGVEYKTNNYLSGIYKINAGTTGEFLVAHDGTITALSQKNSQMRYGYLISYFEDSKGLSGKSQILLLDQSGKYYEYTLAEKVKLDGSNPLSYSNQAIKDALSNQGYPRYQVLKYKLNEEGKISAIDTASGFESGTGLTDKYVSASNEEDNLKVFVDDKKTYFYRTYNVFSPYATVGGHTIIFRVPKILAESENVGSESDKRLAFYDKKYFTVESKTSLKSYGDYLISIYDQNAYMQPGVVLLYDGKIGKSDVYRQNATPYVVEKITDAINGDMETVKKMSVWGKGEYTSFMLSAELCKELGTDGMPKPGDIITMSLDSNNEVRGIDVDVRYTATKAEIGKTSSSSNDYNYYTGKVFNAGNGTVLLKMEDGPAYTATYGTPVDGLVSFSVNSGTTTYFVQYNTALSKAKPIKQNDLKTILASGGDASYIAVYGYYHGAWLVVEYTD